uniref:PIN domain-containing protein n=1 Tax=candidate division CPR3 bacterium TaxID=2268181 RepID=A0A7V3J9Y5_UNCC3
MNSFYLSDVNLFIIFLVIGIIFLGVARRILKFPPFFVFIGLIGLLLGLVLGNLLGSPFSRLPGLWGYWTPIVIQIVVAATVIDYFLSQTRSWSNFFENLFTLVFKKQEKFMFKPPEIVVDTSVFIDGRIEELAKTGFILGKLIVPRFVLDELQRVSDSRDDLKRSRGRRGLEVLSRLTKNPQIETEIIETDFREREIDKKLIRLAKARGAKLLTCDYNLNRVAEIQGVDVLNINELTNALRPIVLPGENLKVKIVAPGKERNQGVGYLPDGTMIVVEDGERFVGEEIDCQVERIYQTVAGKMIFVKPK